MEGAGFIIHLYKFLAFFSEDVELIYLFPRLTQRASGWGPGGQGWALPPSPLPGQCCPHSAVLTRRSARCQWPHGAEKGRGVRAVSWFAVPHSAPGALRLYFFLRVKSIPMEVWGQNPHTGLCRVVEWKCFPLWLFRFTKKREKKK